MRYVGSTMRYKEEELQEMLSQLELEMAEVERVERSERRYFKETEDLFEEIGKRYLYDLERETK